MAKIELQGFEGYLRQLSALRDHSLGMCKATVYAGAEILADELKKGTEALPTISDAQAKSNFRAGRQNPALSDRQKAGLLAGFGVTKIRQDRGGFVQCSVGFSGYNTIRTRKFPGGQPNPEVARSLEKGTSYLRRDAFAARAVRNAKDKAEAAMAAEADTQIKRIMDENAG